MTILFLDGFDWTQQTGDLLRKWDSGSSYFTTTTARTGGRAVGLSGGLGGSFNKTIGLETTVACGFGFRTNNMTGSNGFFRFVDEGATVQTTFYYTSAGEIVCQRGTSTELGRTDTGVLSQDTWYYVEVKVTISATVGIVIIRVNEQVELSLSSQNTKAGTDYIATVRPYTSGTKTNYFDDLYVTDGEFLGDGFVRTYLPTSNGTHTDFTPSAGSNYENVDDTDPDDDSTYNQSNVLGAKDSYVVTPSITGIVKALQVQTMAKKTGAQAVKIKNLIRSGGSDYNSTEEKSLGTDYSCFVSMHETDPDDSNPWTNSKISSAEFGLEITAITTTTTTT